MNEQPIIDGAKTVHIKQTCSKSSIKEKTCLGKVITTASIDSYTC